MTSVSSPPTLPPRCSSATSTESFICLPMIAGGPLSVVMKPIFSFCCAWTGVDRANAAAATPAAIECNILAMVVSSSCCTRTSLARQILHVLNGTIMQILKKLTVENLQAYGDHSSGRRQQLHKHCLQYSACHAGSALNTSGKEDYRVHYLEECPGCYRGRH